MMQQAETFRARVARVVSGRYLLYLPPGYAEQKRKRWPLVLFLHGAGERGDNLDLVKTHGPPKLVEEGRPFPFLLASPQCPADEWWDIAALGALVEVLTKEYRVDPNRIYLTGISMGGYGTWALAQALPDRFAAIVPVCGGGRPLTAQKIAHVPVWAFHGAKDETVPLRESERMVNALKKAGAKKVRFTVYPDAGHDSWTETYLNDRLYTWLLAQRRRSTP
jgi:predicted peptidase